MRREEWLDIRRRISHTSIARQKLNSAREAGCHGNAEERRGIYRLPVNYLHGTELVQYLALFDENEHQSRNCLCLFCCHARYFFAIHGFVSKCKRLIKKT